MYIYRVKILSVTISQYVLVYLNVHDRWNIYLIGRGDGGGGGTPYIRTSVARQYIYIGILVCFDSLFYWLDLLSSFESSFLKILNICGSHVCPRTEHIYAHWGEGGGGGTRIIYCIRGSSVRAHPKKGGGLRCWHSAKNGVSVADTTRKRGGGGC